MSYALHISYYVVYMVAVSVVMYWDGLFTTDILCATFWLIVFSIFINLAAYLRKE